MKIQTASILLLGLLLSFNLTLAAESCLSGSPSQLNIVNQLTAAKANSAVTEVIYRQYNLNTASKNGADHCLACAATAGGQKRPEDIAQVASSIEGVPSAPKLLFKSECLNESNEFDANTTELSCPDGKMSHSKNLCVSSELMTYQNAAISSFLSCGKKLGFTTLSPSLLYAMYSLESGFKPQFSSGSGLGMGQLTSVFVKDVHQGWRGRPFLEKIGKSDLKECEAAKIIANRDLKNPSSRSKLCSFVQVGEGLERNILYTMVGIANSWERDISPKLKSFLERNAGSPLLEEIKGLTLANAYGAGGRGAGRAIANRLSNLSPEKYLEQIKQPMPLVHKKAGKRTLNIYTIKMAERQKKIGEALPEPIKAAFAQEGAQACINH